MEDRNGYAPSIMQEERVCYLCGRNGRGDRLDRHEIFSGAYRSKSKALGLWVYLCHHDCHIFGRYAVHQCRETADRLRRDGQRAAMAHYGLTVDEFIKEFGQNFL